MRRRAIRGASALGHGPAHEWQHNARKRLPKRAPRIDEPKLHETTTAYDRSASHAATKYEPGIKLVSKQWVLVSYRGEQYAYERCRSYVVTSLITQNMSQSIRCLIHLGSRIKCLFYVQNSIVSGLLTISRKQLDNSRNVVKKHRENYCEETLKCNIFTYIYSITYAKIRIACTVSHLVNHPLYILGDVYIGPTGRAGPTKRDTAYTIWNRLKRICHI